MDFGWTPEQMELARTLRAFVKKEIEPHAPEWGRSGRFPPETWRRLGEMGLMGLRVPEAYGGQGADYTTFGIAIEEVGRGDIGCTYGMQLSGLAGEIIGAHGHEEVRARWLPRVATGEALVCLALTEPGAGSDAASIACRAERRGDDYVLTGEKSGITLGMFADAAVLFARTGGEGAHGVTGFLVPLDLPGIARSPLRDMGSRAIARAVIALDGVRVPVTHRLGAEGTGFHTVMRGFDYNRVGIALACLGAAQASLEETLAYVKERRTFGVPLSRQQGVVFPLAEAATHLEAARLLCYRALWLADRGEPHTKEGAMVKWWGPRLSVDVIHQCLLLHGHYGYTDEFPFEQRLRDVMGLEIGDGTAEIMKLIVARQLLGREHAP